MPVFTPNLAHGLLWVTVRACMSLPHLMVLVGIVAGRVISSNSADVKHSLSKSEDLSLLHLSPSLRWFLLGGSFTTKVSLTPPVRVQQGSESHIFSICPHCQFVTCLLHMTHVYCSFSCESSAHFYIVSTSHVCEWHSLVTVFLSNAY